MKVFNMKILLFFVLFFSSVGLNIFLLWENSQDFTAPGRYTVLTSKGSGKSLAFQMSQVDNTETLTDEIKVKKSSIQVDESDGRDCRCHEEY